MILATTRPELREALDEAREKGQQIGLVPTMGYLHEGHLSLVDLARSRAEFAGSLVWVS